MTVLETVHHSKGELMVNKNPMLGIDEVTRERLREMKARMNEGRPEWSQVAMASIVRELVRAMYEDGITIKEVKYGPFNHRVDER